MVDPTKKMLIVFILDVLRKYSDAEHTLSQKDILEILDREYDMKAERKSVKRNLQDLKDMGYDIRYKESVRMTTDPKTGKKEESMLTSDYYLAREFTDAELRLLIDSILFSRHIPEDECEQLADKLCGLSNKYFRSHVRHISRSAEAQPQSPELFRTISVLDEAINKTRKVRFAYLDYGTDKKLHKKKNEDGTVREYLVSPYQMATKDGNYYLICNYDRYDDISNYRVDRIADIEMTDEVIKPFDKLKGSDGRRLDLAEYMNEHIYMYSSGNVRARFRIVKEMISDVIDIFGTDVRFLNSDKDHVEVYARVNERAMFQFAKNYAPDVLVLSPDSLVEKVREDAKKVMEAYK